MSKIMALDLGDQWTGVALTDASRLFVRPYTTISRNELETFIETTIKKETVDLIVIGYPKTMKGGESEQTRKILAQKKVLEEKFPDMQFVLWDERLSSQRAQALSQAKNREEKLKSHALAAAFILDSYVIFLQAQKAEPTNIVDKEG
jgi:putative Holliday junction resolvase